VVIIFSSVQFLSKKYNKIGFKKKLKPIQIDRFWFGSVILEQKSVFSGFARVFSGFAWVFFDLSLIRFFRFQVYKTKTKLVGFFKNSNRFNWFCFTVRFF
jgi:hypothetical protein